MKHTQREKQQAKRTLHHQLQMSQVRRGDQPRYPHLLWPLRWTIAHSKRMVPLLTKKRLVTGHSVTPHTHTQYTCLWRRANKELQHSASIRKHILTKQYGTTSYYGINFMSLSLVEQSTQEMHGESRKVCETHGACC